MQALKPRAQLVNKAVVFKAESAKRLRLIAGQARGTRSSPSKLNGMKLQSPRVNPARLVRHVVQLNFVDINLPRQEAFSSSGGISI